MVFPKHHVVKIHDGDNSREREIPRIRKYNENESNRQSEYVVFIQKLPSVESMNQVKLARKLVDKYGSDISFWYLTNRKMKVVCKCPKVANSIATWNELLIDYNVSIIFSKAEVKGKIPIPAEYSEEEIFKHARSYLDKGREININILEVIRIQKKNISNKEKKDNTDIAIITFEGHKIPNYIKFDYLYLPVYPYTERVLQCQKCWAFGHSTKACRSKQQRCVGCGTHETHVNCEVKKCINCNGSHRANSKDCPIWIQRIKQLKEKSQNTVIRNSDFQAQSEQTVVNPTDIENFPPLSDSEIDPPQSEQSQSVTDVEMTGDSAENTNNDESQTRKRKIGMYEQSQSVISEIKTKFNKCLNTNKPRVNDLVKTLESDMDDVDKSIVIETYFNNKIDELVNETTGFEGPTTSQSQ